MLAPTAFNRLAHADGEMAAARAARAAGTIMSNSTLSTCALEEVAEACDGPLWFQLYVYKDRPAVNRVDRQNAGRAGAEQAPGLKTEPTSNGR